MVTEEDVTLSGECTTQYTEGMLKNCTLETYVILLTNVNPIHSVEKDFCIFSMALSCTGQ